MKGVCVFYASVLFVFYLYVVYFVLSRVLAATDNLRRLSGNRQSEVVNLGIPMTSFPSGGARRHSARVWPCSSAVSAFLCGSRLFFGGLLGAGMWAVRWFVCGQLVKLTR